MSYFTGKNWTRVDTEDGTIIVRVYDSVYTGPDAQAAETYFSSAEGWMQQGATPFPVEDVALIDSLDEITTPVDHALFSVEAEPEVPFLPAAPTDSHDHVHGDETHVH